jgi:MFS family permease
LRNADFGLRIKKAVLQPATRNPNSTIEESAFRNPKSAIGTALRRVFVDFRDGLRYVRRDSVLAAAFVVAAGWGLGNGAARALYSIFGAQLGVQAAKGWGAGFRFVAERPTDFGISVLFVAMGLGGVLGAPLARRFNRGSVEEMGTRMGRSLTLDGCGLLLFSFMPNLFGAAAVLVAREMNFAIWWTAQQTLLMKRTEDAFAGRVFASYETLTTLTMVGSILVCGEVADRVGIRPVAAGGGSVVILSGLLWFVLRRRGREKR